MEYGEVAHALIIENELVGFKLPITGSQYNQRYTPNNTHFLTLFQKYAGFVLFILN